MADLSLPHSEQGPVSSLMTSLLGVIDEFPNDHAMSAMAAALAVLIAASCTSSETATAATEMCHELIRNFVLAYFAEGTVQ